MSYGFVLSVKSYSGYLMLAAFLQKLFFKEVKVTPHARWVAKAEKAASVEQVQLTRRYRFASGNLHLLVLGTELSGSDRVDYPFCTCMDDTVVIFAHPINKKAKYFFTETGRAQLYLNCGAKVVIFDFNGFGESDRIDLFYWRDAQKVIEFVKEKYPAKKIILHGASFGAFHVIRASSALPLGSTLVLENVNKSLVSYWKRWPTTFFVASLLEICRFPAIREMNVKSFLKSLNRPDLSVKFLACEKDTFTTVEEMQELFEIFPLPQKSFILFEGAHHLTANAKNKTLYEQILKKKECQIC